MAREDWPIKISERNIHALTSNLFNFQKEATEALEDAVIIAANNAVRIVKTNARRKTGYMIAHVFLHVSPNRRAFEVGWRREDFIGHLSWEKPTKKNPEGRYIKTFYPVPQETGWTDKRTGTFHPGMHVLTAAMAQTQGFILEAVSQGIGGAASRARGRGV